MVKVENKKQSWIYYSAQSRWLRILAKPNRLAWIAALSLSLCWVVDVCGECKYSAGGLAGGQAGRAGEEDGDQHGRGAES